MKTWYRKRRIQDSPISAYRPVSLIHWSTCDFLRAFNVRFPPKSNNSRNPAVNPLSAAECTGVHPVLSSALTSAPDSSRTFTTPSCFHFTATCNAVQPLLSRSLRSTAPSINVRTILSCPRSAAICRGKFQSCDSGTGPTWGRVVIAGQCWEDEAGREFHDVEWSEPCTLEDSELGFE